MAGMRCLGGQPEAKNENSHGWLGQMKTAAKNKTSERVSGVLPT